MALAYLASNLDPSRYEAQVIDCALDDLAADDPALRRRLRAFAPDVVGVSTWSPMFPEALAILRLAKDINPAVTTVLGGAHASSYAERCMEYPAVDYLFSGEAELAFPRFLEQLQRPDPDFSGVDGLVWRTEQGLQRNADVRAENLDVIAVPDADAMHLEAYQRQGYRWNSPPVPNAPLWVTRGCPYRCQYCAAPELNGRPVRTHSVAYMMRWIQALYDRGVRWFNIIDDNFTYHVAYAKAFCRAVIDLDLEDAGFGTPNGIRMSRGDPELWRLMKQAGWRHLIVAPESGSTDTLEAMKKDLKLGIVPKVVADIQAAGLKCQAFFIVGYPGETAADIEETFALIRRCKFNFVFLANFQPLPGTPVYDDLVAAGEIPDGLLPFNFSDGVRVYTPPELQDFNFAKFILKTHAMMAVSNPRNVPYHARVLLHLYKPRFVLKKGVKTAWAMVHPEQQQPAAPFMPLHRQAQALQR
jgi:anaerobic magnesium-protoporphyrin IX monomethyl ester cyclase